MSDRPKLKNLLAEIRAHIKAGTWLDTTHAVKRQQERHINREDMLYVLETGFHEKRKDAYNNEVKTWNYAMRGKTVDMKEIRVVVSFDSARLLIITVIPVGRGSRRP